MRDDAGLGDLAAQFRRFAVGVGRDGATRYARICEGVAEDPSLLELVASARPDQRRPNILLASVHDLLLAGTEDPLAAHYPTVLSWRGDDPSRALDPSEEDPFGAFASFCARHRDAVAELVATRATQTNEVGRCAAILPALSAIAASSRAPLALLDLGAAAGLNLLFDHYGYRYAHAHPGVGEDGGEPPPSTETAGDPGSPVLLRCEVREGRPPTGTPPVTVRVGLDRHPVDVRDDDRARWLLACQWPDHLDRFEVARHALTVARATVEPPPVHRGDALEDLVALAAEMPSDSQLCVLHTWVAAYFTPDQQRALAQEVARVGSTRPVSWLFAEAPYEVPGLPMPPAPGDRERKVRGATALVLVELAPGRAPAEHRLADLHSHGRWLRWYGMPS